MPLEPDDPPKRPRWVFRGDDTAWDALADALARAPDRPVPWPIAPSGPSMDPGDRILLWRSGRGGGIAAAATVLSEPDAALDPDGRPRVTVEIRVDRALRTPLAPPRLLEEPSLRPLAFMDVLDATELRLNPAQQVALEQLFERDQAAAGSDADRSDDPGRSVSVEVPIALRDLVEELLVRLGARDPSPPRPGLAAGRPVAATPSRTSASGPTGHDDLDRPEPSDTQHELAQAARAAHGTTPFTVDEVAVTWRTGVGTARSRIDRMLEVGLFERAGTLRAEERPGVRPTRGRPPVLYRLAAVSEPDPAPSTPGTATNARPTVESTRRMES